MTYNKSVEMNLTTAGKSRTNDVHPSGDIELPLKKGATMGTTEA